MDGVCDVDQSDLTSDNIGVWLSGTTNMESEQNVYRAFTLQM